MGKMGRGEGRAGADGDTSGEEEEEGGVVAATVVVAAAAAVEAVMAEESRPSWFWRPDACIALHWESRDGGR